MLSTPPVADRPVALRIGLIALATDHTSERDYARMIPPGQVGVYVNRIAYENPTNRENLLRMQPHLKEAAAMILPGERLDALVFSCTAASVEIGDELVHNALQAAKPDATTVTPISSAMAAFETLGIKRLGLLTPYTPEVTENMARYFAQQGLEIVHQSCFGLEDDRVMARVEPEAIVQAAVETDHSSVQGLFISCTGLRAAEVAQQIEERIGKPVVTSNQSTVWQSLRLAGYGEPVSGYGRLLMEH